MDWEYVGLEDVDLSGALLVAGLPSARMVGALAAGFLVEHLEMRIVGTFQSDRQPPIVVVRQGVAASPVQVWATELVCGPDGRCDRLAVIRSDAPVPPDDFAPLASAVTAWAAQRRVRLLVGLDDYRDEDEKGEVVSASSRHAADAAKSIQASPLDMAVLGGATALLLARANRHRLPAIGLFVPAHDKEERHARAAARLLETVDPLVPQIRLGAGELLKRAEALAVDLRKQRERQAREVESLRMRMDPSYG